MNTDQIAATHLGKKSSGSELYDSSLLVAVPREENRKQYNIDNENLPFYGWDVWHAYEFSCLTEHGLPVSRILKIKYNCESEFIIESKSLKLYLNSFNMTRLGKSTDECLSICKKTIEKDLSEKLKTKVLTYFLANNDKKTQIFDNFCNLMDKIDEKTLKIEKFKEAPEVLKIEKLKEAKANYLMFNSLRSNCRVTHQPDFGDVFIYYKSQNRIEEASLVKYLCSFRAEYHFHEECCEMIFKRLHDILNRDDELFVCALYTRRGGIDICPVRFSKNCKIKDADELLNPTNYATYGIRQ